MLPHGSHPCLSADRYSVMQGEVSIMMNEIVAVPMVTRRV
jgi:hypothetical protein